MMTVKLIHYRAVIDRVIETPKIDQSVIDAFRRLGVRKHFQDADVRMDENLPATAFPVTVIGIILRPGTLFQDDVDIV
jgi:hypothetical protein